MRRNPLLLLWHRIRRKEMLLEFSLRRGLTHHGDRHSQISTTWRLLPDDDVQTKHYVPISRRRSLSSPELSSYAVLKKISSNALRFPQSLHPPFLPPKSSGEKCFRLWASYQSSNLPTGRKWWIPTNRTVRAEVSRESNDCHVLYLGSTPVRASEHLSPSPLPSLTKCKMQHASRR